MKTPCNTKMIYALGLFLMIGSVGNAQFFKKLKKRAEESINRTVERKVEEKTEQKTEQAIDSLFQIGKGKKRKKNGKDAKNEGENESEMSMDEGMEDIDMIEGPAEATSFKAYSKFDFIPGETIIGFEDFSQDEIGDLPARWNTNSSAEVVTLEGLEGKWMKMGKGTSAYPADFIESVPENFTLEFDVVFDFESDKWAYSRSLGFLLSDIEDPNYKLNDWQAGTNMFRMNLLYLKGAEYYKRAKNPNLNSEGNKAIPGLLKEDYAPGKVFHVSIWRQKTRVRVYVDNNKVFDVPRAFEKEVIVKSLRLQSHISEDFENAYIGNIRYAVGKPDMRNKLLTEGKLVTYGITFDSGSAILRPESHGTLKKVATILNENPELQVEILGHTDADGDADFNMDLSMMRASAVAQALEEQFGVSAEQLSSNGKGETELLDEGNSLESKAKNRRVEFIKQ